MRQAPDQTGPDPPSPADTVGLVLVGGASTRMGRDKATLDFGGRELASVAVRALHDIGIPTVTTVGPFAIASAHRCDDLWPGAGPLGGIASGIEWATARAETTQRAGQSIVVLACDLPFVDAAALGGLFAAAAQPEAGDDGVLGYDGERSQPLFSLLHRPSFVKIRAAFDSGERSPRQVFAGLSMSVAQTVDDGRLADVDTPDQLAAAKLMRLEFPEIPPTSG